MKAINKACQILAIILAVGALALFFVVPFATIVTADGDLSLVAAELAFGGKVWKSSHIMFCFFLTVFSAIFAALTFKFKGMRYAAPVVAAVDAVYMLVIYLKGLKMPERFIEVRPLDRISTTPTWVALGISLVMFAAFAFGVAHLFVDDYIEVSESKGKRTILRRFIQFLRDYKSEVKKITWPTLRDVAKNTLVVLVISALVGVFIWLVDWGLGSLMEAISKIA